MRRSEEILSDAAGKYDYKAERIVAPDVATKLDLVLEVLLDIRDAVAKRPEDDLVGGAIINLSRLADERCPHGALFGGISCCICREGINR